MTTEKPTGLALLRAPFEPNQIGKLPKPTKKQTDEVRADYKKGIRCKVCGQWHHKDVVHLDYVGHAALTDRLLDCDPEWNWEPVSTTEQGAPMIDANGGMWIKLTVCGVTRLGYGDADGKKGGSAVKEVIGDALRNAAMRFGAALDLWHKGDLHVEEDGPEPSKADPDPKQLAQEAGDRLKMSMDRIVDVVGCDMDAFSKAHSEDWALMNKAARDFLSDRMSKRRGLLSQKPPENSEYSDIDFGKREYA